MSAKLTQFLRAVFSPGFEGLPGHCWVSKAAKPRSQAALKPLGEAINVVECHSQLGQLSKTIRQEHPLDRQHQCQHDARVRDRLTEACAFAWADLMKLGSPRFWDESGFPDIRVDTGYCIEAKAIHGSEEDAKRTRDMNNGKVVSGPVVPPGQELFNKFEDAFTDAKKKFDRAGCQKCVVFYNFTWLDTPQNSYKDEVLSQLSNWATAKEPDSVVICYRYDWQKPIRDPFAL